MPWGTIKFISLGIEVGSGVTTDEIRSGSCQKVGVTTVRVSSSR